MNSELGNPNRAQKGVSSLSRVRRPFRSNFGSSSLVASVVVPAPFLFSQSRAEEVNERRREEAESKDLNDTPNLSLVHAEMDS